VGRRLSWLRGKLAYDRIITRFSPEGRLFQVEYAFETVKHGETIIGLACSGGVVLGAEERVIDKLEDPHLSWKIYELDEHAGASIAGVASDARVLVEQARIYAQSNRLMYDEPVDTEILVKRIGDIKQRCTQQIGVRPYGVSFIIGGVDKTGNRVFKTDPSGSYRSYNAVAEGIGREMVEEMLKEEYRSDATLSDAVKLAAKCLMTDLETRRHDARLRIATIPMETGRFTMLPEMKPFVG